MVCLSSFIDCEFSEGKNQVLFFWAYTSVPNMFAKWVSRMYYGDVRGLDGISPIPYRKDSSGKGKWKLWHGEIRVSGVYLQE